MRGVAEMTQCASIGPEFRLLAHIMEWVYRPASVTSALETDSGRFPGLLDRSVLLKRQALGSVREDVSEIKGEKCRGR